MARMTQEASRPLYISLEAILFASDEPMSIERLKEGLSVSEEEIEKALLELERQYEGRGITIARIQGGYQIVTRPEYHEVIEKVTSKKGTSTLSKGALETLAIIAYKQPVTRQDIEAIRGVSAEASIETLLEKGLIKEVGRKKSLGRPKLYGTTDEFLRKFSLNSLNDLPELPG